MPRLCRRLLPLAVALLLGGLPSLAAAGEPPQDERFAPARRNGVPNRYIVVLEDQFGPAARPSGARGPGVPEVASDVARLHGAAVPLLTWDRAFPGFLVELPEGAARALSRDPRVRFVEQDAYVELQNVTQDCFEPADPVTDTAAFPMSPQGILCADPQPAGTGCFDNWGLDRIDQRLLPKRMDGLSDRDGLYSFDLATPGVTVHAYLLDTGITAGHQELQNGAGGSRVGAGVNAAVKLLDPQRGNVADCGGHGTHVAGILAGITYGVAKDVQIHPVKIRSACTGGILISSFVEGVNWILANRPAGQPAVASISANGTGFLSLGVALAVTSLVQSGVTLVQSAGNQNQPAANVSMVGPSFPQEIIIAGGMDERDGRWTRTMADPSYSRYCPPDCGSNYGTAVDIWAPASHIVSSSRLANNALCWLSGTSMAAPHVSGTAALLLGRFPNASPSAVEKAIKNNGTAGAVTDALISPSERLLNSRFPATGGPVAGDDRFFTPPGTPLYITFASLLAGDFDWDRDPLSIVSFGTPSSGQLQVLFDRVRYTPAAGFVGEATFPYTVTDSHGNNDTALVRMRVENQPLPPLAVDDYFNDIAQGQTIDMPDSAMTGNDSSRNGYGLRFKEIVRNPSNGTLGQDILGHRIYTPNPGFKGTDTFVYRVFEETTLLEADATVYLTVGNRPPQPAADSLATYRDTRLSIGFNQLLANDTDPDGDSLWFYFYDFDTPHGSNDCCHAGGFNYTPDPGFVGTDQFSYQVTDRGDPSGLIASGTITVNVRSTTGFEGYHDGAKCNAVRGWAWDRNNPNERLDVDIYDGSILVGRVRADQFRGDLLAIGAGDGFHSFSWPVPDWLKNGSSHAISVRFAAGGQSLSNTPRTLLCGLPGGGYHDGTTCNNIFGWAWFPSQPTWPVDVDIYDGVTRIGWATASAFRQDLLDGGFGDGRHGFLFPTPPALRDGRAHSIKVTLAGSPDALGNTPQPLTCADTIGGYHDVATCNAMAGWAWDAVIPNTSIEVDVYDNGTLLMPGVRANQFRQDLANAGFGNGYHGFWLATPAVLKDGQPHTIEIRIAGSAERLQLSPKTITCPP